MSSDGASDKGGEGKTEVIGCTVLIVNDNQQTTESIRAILKKDLGVDDKNIKIAANSSEAVDIIRTAREGISLLIVQEKISGRQFEGHVREEFFKGSNTLQTVTNSQIKDNSETPDEVSSSAFLKIQAILRKKPEFLKDILDSLNVLIITDVEERRHQLTEVLLREGVAERNIFLADESTDKGLDIVIDGVSREISSGESGTKRKEHIHTVIIDEKTDPSFIELLQQSDRGVFPFTVVLRDDGALIGEPWQSAKLDSNKMQLMGRSEFDGDVVDDVASKSNVLNKEQLLAEAKKQQSHRDKPDETLITVEGANVENECFYDGLAKMPTLRRAEGFTELRNKLVALFDVDGTLAQAFVMGRFAEFLSKNDVFNGLLRNIPAAQRVGNKQAMSMLLNITGFLSAPGYVKAEMTKQKKYRDIASLDYEPLIERLNLTYASMLKGMDVRDVCRLGYQFSKDDVKAPNILMSYARPVIDLVKKCGMTTSLLTGMPAEALGGYKDALDIRERCYPLELTTSIEGGKRIYSGGVSNSGGLAGDKLTTARAISTNGNDILMYMGDQVSDLSPMYEAMKAHGGIFGLGYVMTNPASADGHALQGIIDRTHMSFLRRGQLAILDKNFTTFLILKRIVSDLYMMSRMGQEINKDRAIQGGYQTMKSYLEYIMEAPLERIQQIYKKE